MRLSLHTNGVEVQSIVCCFFIFDVSSYMRSVSVHCEGQGLTVRRWCGGGERVTHSCVSTNILYAVMYRLFLYDCVFIVISIFYNTFTLHSTILCSCQPSHDTLSSCWLLIYQLSGAHATRLLCFLPFHPPPLPEINGSLHSSAYNTRTYPLGFSVHLLVTNIL